MAVGTCARFTRKKIEERQNLKEGKSEILREGSFELLNVTAYYSPSQLFVHVEAHQEFYQFLADSSQMSVICMAKEFGHFDVMYSQRLSGDHNKLKC